MLIVCVFASFSFIVHVFVGQKGGSRKVDPEGWAQPPRKSGAERRRVGSEGWSPEGWESPKFRAFFSCPATFFILSPSLWVASRGILVVFEAPHMCTFRVLGLSCETPAAQKPPGFHTTAREPNCMPTKTLTSLSMSCTCGFHRRPDCDEECELVLYSMPTHRFYSDCVQQLGCQ